MTTLQSALKRLWTIATMPDYVMGLAPVPGAEQSAYVASAAPLPRPRAFKTSGH